MMSFFRVSVVASLALVSACAGAQRKGTMTEAFELRRQVDALRRQADRDARTIRELENRSLVCEDKLETAQVALGRTDATPRLPVQRLHRDEDPAPAAAPPPPQDDPIATGDPEPAWDDGVEIVYEGEAAKDEPYDDQPRRVIRIHDTPPSPEPAPTATPEPAPVIPPAEAPPEPPAPAPADPMALYKASYAALARHDHVTAVAGFKTFLEKWPDHDYADNSQYWLGEAWYDMGDYKTALAEFRKVVKKYPLGNKTPDALLKMGYCYAKLDDAEAARDVLGQVTAIYPTSDAAKLAQKKLDELKR